MDLPDAYEMWPLIKEAFAERGIQTHAISAVSGEGVQALLWAIAERLSEIPAVIWTEEVDETPAVDEKAFTISSSASGWHVRGIAIERAAQMTNWNQEESAARFQRILEAMGITMALREAGVAEGDTVFVGKVELQWGWEQL